MRKRRTIATAALALAFVMIGATALAATVDIDTVKGEVFANGNDITIQAGTGGTGTFISTTAAVFIDGDENTDVTGYTIYGGSKNASITDDTSITMTGGSVGTIYGGGLNGDTGETNITISGGKVGTVYGGGHAAGSSKNAHTGERNITIKGGSITGDVYAGGHAVSGFNDAAPNADNSTSENITISGGNITGNIYLAGHADAPSTNPYSSGANANVSGNANITIVGNAINEDKIISPGKIAGHAAQANFSGHRHVKHEEAPKPQTITTTFKYGYYDTENVFHQVGDNDVKVSTLIPDGSETVNSSRGETECYNAAVGERTVKYGDTNEEIIIILNLRNYPFDIKYVYYEGDNEVTGTVIQTDKLEGNVTCQGTLTTSAFGLANNEYEVVGALPDPYVVTHKVDLVKTFYIKVAKKQTGGGDTGGETGDDNPGGGDTGGETPIPLGPGAVPNQRIPLGAPRTGAGLAFYGLISLLGFAGAAVLCKAKKAR